MGKRSYFLAHSAIIAALYMILCYLQNLILPGSASWAIQMRAAEALSVLAFFTPAAIPSEQKPVAPSTSGQKTFVNPAVVAADKKSERERYYAALQAKAQAVADQNERRAMADPEFKKVCSNLSKLERETAKAEIFASPNLPDLLRESERLQKRKLQLLADMNMTIDDLLPQYQCKKCSDSGFLPDGRACDCYP